MERSITFSVFHAWHNRRRNFDVSAAGRKQADEQFTKFFDKREVRTNETCGSRKAQRGPIFGRSAGSKGEKRWVSGGQRLAGVLVRGPSGGVGPAGSLWEQYAKWRYADLPILPAHWKYDVARDKKKQLGVLRRLMEDKRVDAVVCATDAGREGELIFRLVYQHAGCSKPILRLWISSMEDAAIRDGFEHLRPGADYDLLYRAALCRAGADWLVGINATRLFSVLYGDTLNVGRVMTPTLALIVQREDADPLFPEQALLCAELTCGGFTTAGEKLEDKAAAEAIQTDCDGKPAVVRKVERQKKTVQPPRLYDLTTLQRECNRLYGFTAQQTLDYLQSLYEKKLATYPRTDSQYITADMQATVGSLALWLWQNMPFGKDSTTAPELEGIIDDSKVTDHHAILPTVEIARTDLSILPAGERDVLMLLACRLLCATAQPHRFEAVLAVLESEGHTFTAKGKRFCMRDGKALNRLSVPA